MLQATSDQPDVSGNRSLFSLIVIFQIRLEDLDNLL